MGQPVVTAVPLGVATTVLHRRLALGESPGRGWRVALAMPPTPVFTLVLARILRDRFALPDAVFGGLIVFALANTLVPGLVLRTTPPAYDEPTMGPRAPTAAT